MRGRDSQARLERGEDGGADELPVHGLTTAEALKSGGDPIPLMTAGFGSGGVAAVVRPLEAILVITLEAATSPRDVRCTHCTSVGDGERDVLAAVAFEQAGRPADTLGKLYEWLPPASARLAKDVVAEIARTLHGGGLVVPLRREYGAWRDECHPQDLRMAVPASLSVH